MFLLFLNQIIFLCLCTLQCVCFVFYAILLRFYMFCEQARLFLPNMQNISRFLRIIISARQIDDIATQNLPTKILHIDTCIKRRSSNSCDHIVCVSVTSGKISSFCEQH